eukprot:3443031-Rhodomonas_salina.1
MGSGLSKLAKGGNQHIMPSFEKFFEELGAGSSRTMDVTQLEKSLLERETALVVSESPTFQKRREEGGKVIPQELEKIWSELERSAVVRFFQSTELQKHFAEAAIAVIKEQRSTMRNPLQPFASIATESRESQEKFCKGVIEKATPLVLKAMAENLVSEKEYKEANESVECDDKYSKMHLGPLAVFDKGTSLSFPCAFLGNSRDSSSSAAR